MKAAITNTESWPNWWFSGHDGKEIYVKEYPHRTTKSGSINYCYCAECVADRKGRTTFKAFEVIESNGITTNGSIIPAACLIFKSK